MFQVSENEKLLEIKTKVCLKEKTSICIEIVAGIYHANKVKYNYTKKKSLSGYCFLQIISCLNYLKTTLCRLTLRSGIPIPLTKIT